MAKTSDKGAAFLPDYAIPPGDTLLEVMESMGLDQTKLAALAGLSRKTINEIVQAKGPLTAETAIRLEAVLGLPASFWNNLEANYRESLARIEAQRRAERAVAQAKTFPVTEMVKRGLLPAKSKGVELVAALQRLFGVADLDLMSARFEMAGAQFRASAKADKPKPALYAWLLEAERTAAGSGVTPAAFDKNELRKAIPAIRALGQRPLNEARPELQRVCGECGLLVVLVPCYAGVGAHGATFWFQGRPVIVVGDHYKREDIFWFTFFHELHHVLYHRRKAVYLEFGRSNRYADEEQEADTFAADTLIPPEAWAAFSTARLFNSSAIVEFAASQQLHPGIVVGRLQHEGRIPASQSLELLRRLG